MNRHTTLSNLRNVAIVLSSVVALSGGVSIETAHARGAGGFGGSHLGGLLASPRSAQTISVATLRSARATSGARLSASAVSPIHAR
jgi:hypothetical protein